MIRRLAAWQWAWLLLAAVTLPAVAYRAYEDTRQLTQSLRVELIRHYSLWEADPDYRGTPQAWTRFAAWLLDTDQLMERVRATQGAVAPQIEADFRRDATFAQARIFGAWLLAWLVPLALLYGGGLLYQRRTADLTRRRATRAHSEPRV
jgi:hypothetical protein